MQSHDINIHKKNCIQHNSLIKTYYQLQLLVIDEISLVSNKTSTFIVHKLCTIK